MPQGMSYNGSGMGAPQFGGLPFANGLTTNRGLPQFGQQNQSGPTSQFQIPEGPQFKMRSGDDIRTTIKQKTAPPTQEEMSINFPSMTLANEKEMARRIKLEMPNATPQERRSRAQQIVKRHSPQQAQPQPQTQQEQPQETVERGKKGKTGLFGPYVRATTGLAGATKGAIKGAYKGVVEGRPEMIENSKEVLARKDLTAKSKMKRVLIGEFVADYIGNNVIGGTLGGGLEGFFKGFTTQSEREDISEGAKEFMTSILTLPAASQDGQESTVGQVAIDTFNRERNKLDERQQKEVEDMTRYGMGLSEFLGMGIMKRGSKVAGRAAKEGLETGVEQFTKTQVGKGVEEAVEKTLDPIEKATRETVQQTSAFIKKQPGEFTDYWATKVGGLEPETVKVIREEPKLSLVESGELSSESLLDQAIEGLSKRKDQISELGESYGKLRDKNVMVDNVPIRAKSSKILSKYGIEVNKKGELDFTNSKFAGDTPDQNAIKKAYQIIQKGDKINADMALNRRQAISKLSRYGTDVSGDGAAIVREFRRALKKQMQKDIVGLKVLDDKFGPEIKILNKLMRDFYTKDGDLKDNATSLVTNLLNRGKELKYNRIKDLVPDMEGSIRALKAYDDIVKATGSKVGTYERSKNLIAAGVILGSPGGMLGSAVGGALGLLVGGKFTDPKNIVKLLKRLGPKGGEVAKKIQKRSDLNASDKKVIEQVLEDVRKQQSEAMVESKLKKARKTQALPHKEGLPVVEGDRTIDVGPATVVTPGGRAVRPGQILELGDDIQPPAYRGGLKRKKPFKEAGTATNANGLPQKEGLLNKVDADTKQLRQILRGTKGMTADDITKKHPDIQLKRDVPAKDIHGNKVKIPEGEALTPYELKGNKVLLQDGKTYIVSKNQFQNIKAQSTSKEIKEFAPELNDLEETIHSDRVDVDVKVEKANDGSRIVHVDGQRANDVPKMIENSETTRERATRIAKQAAKEDFVSSNKFPTRYSRYQLPNGENYKEILIKAPLEQSAIPKKEIDQLRARAKEINKQFGELNNIQNKRLRNKTEEELLDELREIRKRLPASGTPKDIEHTIFRSSHREELNVVSHLRMNDRTYKGKKVSFMEELQSDWARRLRDRQSESSVLRESAEAQPDHPSLKNWQELSIKRALKEAVDGDAEYFSWINGKQTSDRYNLATKLDGIEWHTARGQEGKLINVQPKDGADFNIVVDDSGRIITSGTRDWDNKMLDEVFGKGLADKIMEKEKGNLFEEGLKFGGEWAQNLYDKQVKNIVEKVTGGKIETLSLDVESPQSALRNFVTDEVLKKGEIKEGTKLRRKGDSLIVTKMLKNGQFEAKEIINFGSTETIGGKTKTLRVQRPTTKQQGIKLTPEIKAKIRGEAPDIKTSGKMFNSKSDAVGLPKQMGLATEPLVKEAKRAASKGDNIIEKYVMDDVFYNKINDDLRAGGNKYSSETRKISSQLEGLPRNSDEKVYRGMDFGSRKEADDFVNSLIGKETYTDKGFVSATKDIERAKLFSDIDGGVIFEIENGGHLVEISKNNIGEVLFDKGTKFQPGSITAEGGWTIIKMKPKTESQLRKIREQANKGLPKKTTNLIEEAKKLTSDEFVEKTISKDTHYYGSRGHKEALKLSDPLKDIKGRFGNPSPDMTETISITPKREFAEVFADYDGVISDVVVFPKNTLDLTAKELSEDAIKYMELNKSELNWNDFVHSWGTTKKAGDFLKLKGYDSIKLNPLKERVGGIELRILDPNIVKTEAQLRKIREQANKGLPKKK